MRMKILLLALILFSLGLEYAVQVNFVKNNDTYMVTCPSVYYDVLTGKNTDYAFIDSTNTAPIDSIVTVQNLGDSLVIFIKKRGFAAFCHYQSGEIQLDELQPMYYDENLKYFYYLDVNKDNKLEFVILTGDDEGCYLQVYSYNKGIYKDSNSSFNYFQTVVKQEVSYPDYPYTDDSSDHRDLVFVKISHNMLYVLYAYWQSGSEYSELRYGMLDYTRDEAKEIFFRPISSISLKKWNKL